MPPASREPDDTQYLLGRVREGSRSAVDELLARHRPYLRRLVEVRMEPRLRRRVDPSDVVQEAQLEAARRLPAYADQAPMPFRLWLRQITYDRLLMLQRRHAVAQRRDLAREVVLPEESSRALACQAYGRGGSPSQSLIRGELARRVQMALQALPDDDREILLMRSFEGLSNAEAAVVLAITPDAASKRYGRALLRLRAALIENGLPESSDGTCRPSQPRA